MADKLVARKKMSAEEMAKEQREISISEFFEKNKHLLGFDNPTKALLVAVKEAVDNSLDACQDADILPDLIVKIKSIGEDKFRVSVQDNGPGIVKEQIPRVFGKMLYGSKFHHLRQNRGQQGIGISACVLYSQLTTGSPTKIWSKTEGAKKGYHYQIFINTAKNEPEIVKEEEWVDGFEHGVRIEMDVTARYRKWVEDYLKQTSVSNPFAKVVYHAPDGTKYTYQRSVNKLPRQAKEMRPHPYGLEWGILYRIIQATQSKTLSGFLVNEFSSVGAQTSKEICKVARLDTNMKPKDLDRDQIEKLLSAMQKVKIQRPPTECVVPIGTEDLEKSLKSEYPSAEFIIVRTRDPEVYRGFPFAIEVGIVYGGELPNETVQVQRFANRVPLLYQAGACATMEAVKDTDWKRYGVQQSSGALPVGPMILLIHMCGVWVPFASEAKEAIAPYPEIVKEIKLAIQDAGRELSRFLSGKRRRGEAHRRLLIFERYSTEVAEALSKLTKCAKGELEKTLKSMIAEKVQFSDTEEGQQPAEEESTEAKVEKKPAPAKSETAKEKSVK